jgi:3-oxoacyl-[acyl-carrier protein] reductase
MDRAANNLRLSAAKGLNRLGLPTIANAATFLASARAEWITGQVLSVNGGYSMVG